MTVGVASVIALPRMHLGQWAVSPIADSTGQNTAMAEAVAWCDGRLTLSENFYEDADFDGKHFNVVGLGFTIISTPVVWLGRQLGWSEAFPSPLYTPVMLIPIWVVSFFALASVTRSPVWAAVMQVGFMLGTPILPVLAICRNGDIYSINHIIAVSGIFLIGMDLLGRQRIWPAAIGLCLAGWSRQMTCLYAIPILWIAIREWRASRPPISIVARSTSKAPIRTDASEIKGIRQGRRKVIWAVFGVGFAATAPMTLNTAKFGNPFDSGYGYMYGPERTDPIGTRGRNALFSLRYIPMHVHAMNLEHAPLDIRHGRLHVDLVDVHGGSIWLTSPITLGVLISIPFWWRDPRRRILMLGTLPVIAGLMTYHTAPGSGGYYRYALDYLPIWWLVMAPYLEFSPIAKRWSVVAIAYGMTYFSVIPWQ